MTREEVQKAIDAQTWLVLLNTVCHTKDGPIPNYPRLVHATYSDFGWFGCYVSCERGSALWSKLCDLRIATESDISQLSENYKGITPVYEKAEVNTWVREGIKLVRDTGYSRVEATFALNELRIIDFGDRDSFSLKHGIPLDDLIWLLRANGKTVETSRPGDGEEKSP